jgi:hypothetical protein
MVVVTVPKKVIKIDPSLLRDPGIKKHKDEFGGGDPCAGGCGGVSIPGSIYCEQCKNDEKIKPPRFEYEHDLEIYTEVLEEQMRDETVIQDRLAERGAGVCGVCGRPSLPWRIYCSSVCRGVAASSRAAQFELDGVMDSLMGHARRLGIDDSTVRKRMRVAGMDPIQALVMPVDKKKSCHFRKKNKKDVK